MNTPHPRPGTDWHPADIQAALKKRGWTLRKLSIAAGYSPNVCSQCLRRPWPSVERVISTALDLEPWQIWPSRYQGPKRKPSRLAHAHNVHGTNNGPKKKGGRHAPAKRTA